jgi:hypothetical protein
LLHRLPADFTLTDNDRALARAKGMTDRDIEHEFEEFRAYHDGKGDKNLDWHAAWRTWYLHWAKWREERRDQRDWRDKPLPPHVSERLKR